MTLTCYLVPDRLCYFLWNKYILLFVLSTYNLLKSKGFINVTLWVLYQEPCSSACSSACISPCRSPCGLPCGSLKIFKRNSHLLIAVNHENCYFDHCQWNIAKPASYFISFIVYWNQQPLHELSWELR